MDRRIIWAAGLIGAGALAGYTFARMREPPFAPLPGPSLGVPSSIGPFIVVNTSSVTIRDATRVVAYLSNYAGQRVVLLLHTLGGALAPVVQIVRAVQRHGNVAAWVPFYALSGGTLIALAARDVFLWPDASLGPVDPQIGPFSASAWISVPKSKPIKDVEDDSLRFAHEAQKAVDKTVLLTRELVNNEAAVKRLVSGTTPHSFPIGFREAAELGLPVKLAPQSPLMWALARRALKSGGCSCLG